MAISLLYKLPVKCCKTVLMLAFLNSFCLFTFLVIYFTCMQSSLMYLKTIIYT